MIWKTILIKIEKEYKAARDAEGESNTRRKVDWRNSSDIW